MLSEAELGKVKHAVDRLNRILPLTENCRNLSTEASSVYRVILRNFVEQGEILNRNAIANLADADSVLRELSGKDMVVVDEAGEPTGAYPFTMEQRDHEVMVNGYKVHAMCALDSLAIATMYDLDTQISSKCHVSNEPVAISLSGQQLNDESDSETCFGINWSSATNQSCCATSLCTEMIFLKDEETASTWQQGDTENREIFTLSQAVQFAAGFFSPVVKHGNIADTS